MTSAERYRVAGRTADMVRHSLPGTARVRLDQVDGLPAIVATLAPGATRQGRFSVGTSGAWSTYRGFPIHVEETRRVDAETART